MTSGTIILDKSIVVILIKATTLMHKSTLSTNNFGNNHFGQKLSDDFFNATFLMHKSTLSTNNFGNNPFGQKYSGHFKYCDICNA